MGSPPVALPPTWGPHRRPVYASSPRAVSARRTARRRAGAGRPVASAAIRSYRDLQARMSRDYSSTIDASDLPRQSEELRAFLVVYHGERSRMVELRDGEEVTIGRSRDAVVDLDDTRVSRLHAAVVRRGRSLYARDLGSRNGTRVNGEPLRAERRVAAGDELAVGGASIVVGLSTPPAATPAVGPVGAGGGATPRSAGSAAVVVVDPAMKRVFELARRVAPTPMTVLLLGETGVGKELVAEEIHRQSPRARQPLVRLNCASL